MMSIEVRAPAWVLADGRQYLTVDDVARLWSICWLERQLDHAAGDAEQLSGWQDMREKLLSASAVPLSSDGTAITRDWYPIKRSAVWRYFQDSRRGRRYSELSTDPGTAPHYAGGVARRGVQPTWNLDQAGSLCRWYTDRPGRGRKAT